MKTLTTLTVILLVPAAAIAAGGGYVIKHSPVKVEKIEGSELSRVILTAKGAERTGIELAEVREGTVDRKWVIAGQVLSGAPQDGAATIAEAKMPMARVPASDRSGGAHNAAPGMASSGPLVVRVPVTPSELRSIAQDAPARILPLQGGKNGMPISAKSMSKMPIDPDAAKVDLVYAVAGTKHDLVPGQRVTVEVTRAGSGERRKIVPYSSLIYDARGTVWVYTNPESLVYVRDRVEVDFIQGEDAYLTDGPALGTKVVSVGAAELYGAETGIGK